MTHREMFLLATSILFASTTAGMALRSLGCHHGMGRPGMERPFGPHGGPDGKRPDFFTMADANKDGFVTKEEMLARQQARLDDMFTNVDTNKDGKLSKEEMEKGRELWRQKMKARFEAEQNGTVSPATPDMPPPPPEAGEGK